MLNKEEEKEVERQRMKCKSIIHRVFLIHNTLRFFKIIKKIMQAQLKKIFQRLNKIFNKKEEKEQMKSFKEFQNLMIKYYYNRVKTY
jgi:hypothetical protein